MSPEVTGAGLYGRPLTRRRSALSMTPLIDVVFIMLLFFMLVTNYQRWQTVSIDAVALPGSSVALAPTPAVLALSHDHSTQPDAARHGVRRWR